jgi:predicted nuclease of predicted toxin-antitoxin system
VKFLVDNQLPAALARFLASRGVECQHVLDVGLDIGTDAEIWEHATRHGFIIISKDEDFLYLANAGGASAVCLD